jgi:high-affinity Fe2+/Pb2+ permease
MAIWVGGAVGTVALLGVYAIMRKGTNLIPTDKIFLYSKYFFIILALYFGYQGIEEIFELLEH